MNDAFKIDKRLSVKNMIKFIGDDYSREGLVDTPDRVVRSWSEIFAGYDQNPQDFVKIFEADNYDEMVICKDIEFYSTCEHHMIPFYGQIHIGYISSGKVIGLSKLARIADCFARRLQIQERLTNQIADFIEGSIKPKGVAVVVEGKHLCMMARGIQKQNSKMVTSSMLGVFREKHEARSEFLELIK